MEITSPLLNYIARTKETVSTKILHRHNSEAFLAYLKKFFATFVS